MSLENIKCPLCKSDSNEAKNKPLRKIVREELKHLIIDESYYFCSNSICEVVFFNKDMEKIFLLEDVNLFADIDEQSGCGCNNQKNGCNKSGGCCGN
ncbi:hypothetical protein [Serpentinicella alkaliphila]|uniref:CopZ zinc binding domain-containing protein n=1 Tax=Serpentinicella alkaliphila TaxID=1734049 RepID=A0A4V2T401_9FIRM|nr:hypothetical protein [Serpentinicella alkaliphila]QUH24639.1 hypothetical protein HZR23_01740 [Serpentinicella alkaliphila]TCQ03104.1 hypothetical protein EDD79_101168 [Serpentinicella alkaliphila]